MAMTKVLISVAVLACSAAAFASDDRFEGAKQDLARAACVQVQFLSVLESDVFDVVDSVPGTAIIAADGRFAVSVGSEEYLYDNERLYTYSAQTDQVIIEKPSGDLFVGNEIALVTRLDRYYRTAPVAAGREYRLTRTDTTGTQLPDELTVLLRPDSSAIEAFLYRDINGDLNRVVLLRQNLSEACADSAFIPAFPESAERIKL